MTRPVEAEPERDAAPAILATRTGPTHEPDTRLRDGADVVAGIGLSMVGGAATLVERLLDGFLGGAVARPAPAPEQDNRPDPTIAERFKSAAAEARQAAEREQEDVARRVWWDEHRSRARD